MDKNYGYMNGHGIGIIMKEMVNRAIRKISAERFIFEQQNKVSYGGENDDLFTSADKSAQEVYVKTIQECFPGFGIIAEEDELRVPCTADMPAYFTIDPLDGTKAFARRQSHGVGTMISLVHDSKVAAAYVGDVLTGEIYGYRPGSDKVHRLLENGAYSQLKVDDDKPLTKQYILLREAPKEHTSIIQKLIEKPKDGGCFKEMEVTGGSIGIMFARLWKGEVGAICLAAPGHDTPWDNTPVEAISRKMGFMFMEVDDEGKFKFLIPRLLREVTKREKEVLIIHETRLSEFNSWIEKNAD
jgi:fructose-1,6-bisphosphatase/inositol monophosphatase family enzyme